VFAFVARSNGGEPLTLQELEEKLRCGEFVPIWENIRTRFVRQINI